ncbi:MAG: biopolymer transporter ExbD [Bdellovibrionales bacterium]|nr:biopolymer transporter ExbD [Bdellovibrionales bacterium]
MKSKRSFKKSRSRHQESSGHNLTSLVDCFAIILVYLLLATSFGEIDLDIPKDMVLPKATEAQSLTHQFILLVRDKSYEIGNRQISPENLTEELKKLADSQDEAKSTPSQENSDNRSIVIQADRKLSWSELNPAVVASLQAGFSEIQFAVLKEENH